MIELLTEIRDSLQPKGEFQIIVSRNKTDFTTIFEPAIQLDPNKEYKIALLDLETYFSFPNIGEENIIKYETPTKEKKEIIIPIGAYEFTELKEQIDKQLERNGDKDAIILDDNLNTFKMEMHIQRGYKIDFKEASGLKEVLGFIKDIYEEGFHIAEKIINILPINSIFVHINIIDGSIVNGSKEPVIYTFFPNAEPGHKIIQIPKNLVYLPVNKNSIRYFHVKLTDQNNRLLNLRGEELTIRFHLKEC